MSQSSYARVVALTAILCVFTGAVRAEDETQQSSNHAASPATAASADETRQTSSNHSGGARPAPDDETPPPIRAFDIAIIKILGRAIYNQDQMAWKASDVLTGQFPMEKLRADQVHGWIVTTAASVNTVRMIDIGANGPEVFCDVTFSPRMSPTCVTPKDRTLAGDELAQYTARQTALAAIPRRCAEQYNAVVLKDPERDGWLVWALAATTVPGEVVYGGHYRYTMSKDGKTIVQRDALSRGCFSQGPRDNSDGGKAVAMAFSQLVSPLPIETTVWLSLEHQLPFFVITPDKKIWKVDGDTITENATPPLPLNL